MTESENKMVARKAGSMVSGRAARADSWWERMRESSQPANSRVALASSLSSFIGGAAGVSPARGILPAGTSVKNADSIATRQSPPARVKDREDQADGRDQGRWSRSARSLFRPLARLLILRFARELSAGRQQQHARRARSPLGT